MVLRIVVCRKEDKHTGTDRCNDGDNSEGMKKGECRMTTTSFPVIQIEKTGKRLRNMRKENGIRVAALMNKANKQKCYMDAIRQLAKKAMPYRAELIKNNRSAKQYLKKFILIEY